MMCTVRAAARTSVKRDPEMGLLRSKRDLLALCALPHAQVSKETQKWAF
jgi:hypothetical protein